MKAQGYSNKLVTGSLVAVITMGAIGLIIALSDQRRTTKELIEASFKASAGDLSRAISLYVKVLNFHGIARTLSESYLSKIAQFVRVENEQGSILFSYPEGIDAPPSVCKSELFRVPVTFDSVSVGNLTYCIDVGTQMRMQFPIKVIIAFLVCSISVGVGYSVWAVREAGALSRFIGMLERIDVENPQIDPVPVLDASKEGIRNLYLRMQAFLERLHAAQESLKQRERESAFIDISRQVAHDIRSPLSTLLVLTGSLSGSIPEEVHRMFKDVCSRIGEIADDLGRKTGPSIGEVSAHSDRVLCSDPSWVVKGIIKEKKLQYWKKSEVTLSYQIRIDSTVRVNMVESALFRILSNLIDNAFEATSSGEINVELFESEGMCRILVQDTGKGIPENVLPRVMEKNFTHGKDQGSGLGLFDARSRMVAAGGEIKLRSRLGEGTIVELTLPIVERGAVWA